MLAIAQIVQVQESMFPLLLYAYPGKPYRQRLGQYLKRIDASAGNINGPPRCMAARAGGLGRLDAMERATVTTGNS